MITLGLSLSFGVLSFSVTAAERSGQEQKNEIIALSSGVILGTAIASMWLLKINGSVITRYQCGIITAESKQTVGGSGGMWLLLLRYQGLDDGI
jgi:hypothetical protein